MIFSAFLIARHYCRGCHFSLLFRHFRLRAARLLSRRYIFHAIRCRFQPIAGIILPIISLRELLIHHIFIY